MTSKNSSNNLVWVNKKENYILLDLRHNVFYLGGLPVGIRAQLDTDTLVEIDRQMMSVLNVHLHTQYNDNSFKRTQPHDVIILFLNDDIIIYKPNNINTKVTNRTNGIIVCGYLHSYTYSLKYKTGWVYRNSGK